MITVKELIDKLAEYPPDLEVVIAPDSEYENMYVPLKDEVRTAYAEGKAFVLEEDWDAYAKDYVNWMEGESIPPYPGDNCLVVGPEFSSSPP